LCSDGANLFVGGKLPSIGLRKGFRERSFFSGTQLDYRLVLACRFFQEFRHGSNNRVFIDNTKEAANNR
jgi:hypothetical protein